MLQPNAVHSGFDCFGRREDRSNAARVTLQYLFFHAWQLDAEERRENSLFCPPEHRRRVEAWRTGLDSVSSSSLEPGIIRVEIFHVQDPSDAAKCKAVLPHLS